MSADKQEANGKCSSRNRIKVTKKEKQLFSSFKVPLLPSSFLKRFRSIQLRRELQRGLCKRRGGQGKQVMRMCMRKCLSLSWFGFLGSESIVQKLFEGAPLLLLLSHNSHSLSLSQHAHTL